MRGTNLDSRAGRHYGLRPHLRRRSEGRRLSPRRPVQKESWDRQAQALAASGFRVVAFDFRSSGQGRRFDVLAAVHYLRRTGAKRLSVVGAGMGGDYAAEAAEAEPDAIDRLVLLASGAYTPLVHTKARKLFILSRDDFMGDDKKPRLPGIRAQFEKASGPKKLVLLDGSAHAQAIFATDQGDRLMREILRFLSAR
ncbi:MAG TPA: alpha/beta fold hydrolase [Bryobacteraceae bacterium]|nr:alpha/beta fold hydrolase [Bryobacteraceae bacterium]